MRVPAQAERGAPAGIPGYPGPYPVGRYALRLQQRLREFAGVCLVGEVTGAVLDRGPNVYFELRDADGAVPCAMWRTDFDRQGLDQADFRDGAQVVAAGRCDYYVGGPSASPRFSFRVRELRLAGEGDLLVRLERLRRQLAGEGLFDPQKRLPRPLLPRTIGVVTAEGGAARRDLLAGLARRGWHGRIVWGYAPVQDRRASAAIAAAIRDLAALGSVEAIVVTRGGGSIADLWAFCDETLCRTVAMLPVPVISAVGHEVDRTLIDDVAAVCCSTPTHAAEAAVGIDCVQARAGLSAAAARIDASGRAALVERARTLTARSRAPREHLATHRRRLHQQSRELRAATARGLRERTALQRRIGATVIGRKVVAARASAHAERRSVEGLAVRLERVGSALGERRAAALREHAAALRGHDPERTLERGYALPLGPDGEPLPHVAAVRHAGRFELRMADGSVPARVASDSDSDPR